MTEPAPAPAFDGEDAARINGYLRRRGLTAVDPFAGEAGAADMILTTSLAGARLIFGERLGMRNATGSSFRGFPLLVARPSANAFATQLADLQVCGMDIGLANAAFEISLFVFSRSSLFEEIGNAAGEQSPKLPDEAQLAFWIADRLRLEGAIHGRPVGAELVPRDGQRQLATHFLTQLMLRFVWLHELYHGLNGHTGLIASQRSEAVLNEMPEDDASELGLVEAESHADAAQRRRRLRHAMEFDADRSALWMLVRMQQIDLEPITGLATWPQTLRLKLTIFAAAMMAFLFDQAARRATRSGSSHPSAQYRLVDLVRTLASHLLDPPGQVRQAFKNVLAEMTALQHAHPHFVSGSRLLSDLHDAALQRELDEIDDALAAARVQFASFAFHAERPL